jgi:hypothetical protein
MAKKQKVRNYQKEIDQFREAICLLSCAIKSIKHKPELYSHITEPMRKSLVLLEISLLNAIEYHGKPCDG